MDVVSYKCPNCAAPLSFDIDSQAFSCQFCGSDFTKDQIETERPSGSQQEDTAGEGAQALHPHEAEEFGGDAVAYECPSCGGRIVTDQNTAATFCIYCHNPTVMASQLKGQYRPDYVIPFKLGKEEAVKAVQKLCKGKPLLPRAFRDSVHKGEVSGLYVPFWLFSCKADARLHAQGRRIATWQDSRYRYTKTDTYAVLRDADMAFKHVPADGSAKMDDTLMESLEPFDYSAMTDFSMTYLSGHYAESYDVDQNECSKRVDPRIRAGVEKLMRDTVRGYNTYTVQNLNIRLSGNTCRYAMLPVWTLMHRFNGKQYVFAMNGQTGKMVGKLPISWGRFAALVGASWLVSLAILMLVVLLG